MRSYGRCSSAGDVFDGAVEGAPVLMRRLLAYFLTDSAHSSLP